MVKKGNPCCAATVYIIGMADQQHITLRSIADKVNHYALICL